MILPRQFVVTLGRTPLSMAAYVGAFLVELDQQMSTVSQLRRFLVAHPHWYGRWAFHLCKQMGGRYCYGKTTQLFPPFPSLGRYANQVYKVIMPIK